MIITKVPLRLSIGGGGTDLPSYYKQFGGHLITSSIDKYMYVLINEPSIPDKIRLHYSQIENVDKVDDIKHDIIRESLKLYGIDRPIEVTSMADMAAGTGMGSSSAFTVALLAGLNAFTGRFMSAIELAETACTVEMELVGNPIGKQDQYASALGGFNELSITKGGNVSAKRLELDGFTISCLWSRLLLFYTGVTHDANVILKEEGEKIQSNPSALKEIGQIGGEIKDTLLDGNVDYFGELLHRHWMIKKEILGGMSSPLINQWYDTAIINGAIGGKLIGAGGGGLMLFCSRENKQRALKQALEASGLKYIDFNFEFEGAKVIYP
jgi:D-glycero-alpha-D-manno-heptose-7-phosphate kinase